MLINHRSMVIAGLLMFTGCGGGFDGSLKSLTENKSHELTGGDVTSDASPPRPQNGVPSGDDPSGGKSGNPTPTGSGNPSGGNSGGNSPNGGGGSNDDSDNDVDLPYDIRMGLGQGPIYPILEAFKEKGGLPEKIVSVTMEGGNWRLEELKNGIPFTITQEDCDHEGNKDIGRDRIFVTWTHQGKTETDHLDLRYCDL